MIIDVQANLNAFRKRRSPGARYASFDYCFNYFQEARDSNETESLARGNQLQLSCLHLGFYLASWGMMRGSGGLHSRSLRELAPVVEIIASEPLESWNLDVPYYCGNEAKGDAVLALADRIQKAYSFSASSTLVSKTMLGVFGCIPAFDRFFRIGFGRATLSAETLGRIYGFYEANEDFLREVKIYTLDFATRQDTCRKYTLAKIIDMIFFEEGFRRRGQIRR